MKEQQVCGQELKEKILESEDLVKPALRKPDASSDVNESSSKRVDKFPKK